MLITTGRAREKAFLPSPQQERALFYKLAEIDKEEFNYEWVPVPPYVAAKCDKLFYNIVVDSQGYVRPCCGITLKLGNVRKRKLSEFMEHEVIVKLRNIKIFMEIVESARSKIVFMGVDHRHTLMETFSGIIKDVGIIFNSSFHSIIVVIALD